MDKYIKIIVVVLFVSIVFKTRAQETDHIKGSQGVELSGGVGDKTFLYRLGYYYWVGQKIFLRGDFAHVMTISNLVKGYSITSYGLDFSASYKVVGIKEKLFFNVFAGMSMMWNSIKFQEGDFKYNDTMKFGFLAGGEMEVRLYKKLMGVLTGDGRYMLGKSFGNWRVYGTLGLRYSF